MGSASAATAPTAPSAPAAPPARYKRLLRNYLLDKRLQLRYVAVVLALSAVIVTTLGVLIYEQSSFASRQIAERLADMAWLDDASKAALVADLVSSDKNLVLVMAGAGIGLAAVLFLYLVAMTHRVAGPLFRMGRYFDDLRDGRIPKVWNLRKGDQFESFFVRFRETLDAMADRARDDAALVDRFVAACEPIAAGEPAVAAALDGLRALKRGREAFLGDRAASG